MYFNKIGGKIRNVKFTPDEQKALDEEIQRQLLESAKKFELDNACSILWTLYRHFGFREERLKKVMEFMIGMNREMEQHYEMDKGDGTWLCRRKLEDAGYDVEGWYNRSGAEPYVEMAEGKNQNDEN